MNKLMASVLSQNSIINGSVVECGEEYFYVESNSISLKARKAFSCLVEPQVDDKVSMSRDGEDLYIIAILERKENQTLNVIAKNGINIIAQDGDITFTSEHSINSFANQANIVISEVSFLSKIVTLKSESINTIASLYHGFIDRVIVRHKSLEKFVDGHEEHQSISSRRVIQGSDIHQVQESITLVKGQMKIDASQINMG